MKYRILTFINFFWVKPPLWTSRGELWTFTGSGFVCLDCVVEHRAISYWLILKDKFYLMIDKHYICIISNFQKGDKIFLFNFHSVKMLWLIRYCSHCSKNWDRICLFLLWVSNLKNFLLLFLGTLLNYWSIYYIIHSLRSFFVVTKIWISIGIKGIFKHTFLYILHFLISDIIACLSLKKLHGLCLYWTLLVVYLKI